MRDTRRRSPTRTAMVLACVGTTAALSLAALPTRSAVRTEQARPANRSPLPSIQDASLVDAKNPTARLRTMARLGARVVRVDLNWDRVARRRPADARNPRDPAYDWSAYDRVVSGARRAGVEILFTVWGTPRWAADPSVPASARYPARATRPRDPNDFGQFGAAVARRYVPRGVRRLEAWNEPNIALFLRPQYERVGFRFRPVSPDTYSRMLTSFYRETKAVSRRVIVGGGVTAPAGEQCPSTCPDSTDDRVTPIAFLRELAQKGRRPPMDVYTHHPYPITRPRAGSFRGAAFVDLYNLDQLQRELDRTYLRGRSFWLTEFGFGTRSVREYRLAVSRADQARYLADGYARVRPNRRIELITWYFLQDHAQWASGLLAENGRPKPAATAFGLPFGAVPATPAARSRLLVGQLRVVRRAARVAVERRAGRRWRRVALVRTTADGSFRLRVAARSGVYRARWRGRDRARKVRALASPPVNLRID